MAARAYWSGHIRLALVSIPVQVFPATKPASRPSFNQIHEPSGKRIRYEKVVPGIGPVDASEIVKGYEVDKGKYVLLTDEEIDSVKLEAKKVVDLVQFVDEGDIDVLYFDKPFFVVPEEGDETGSEAYVVLRDALRSSGKVGLGQIVVRGSSSIVAIKPIGDGLLMEMLRYPAEIRKGESMWTELASIKPDKELVSLAKELIGRKAGKFDPSVFKDRYSDALHELIEAKLEDRPPEDIEAPMQSAQVIDLMEALKRSVARKGEAAPPALKAASAKKANGAGTKSQRKSAAAQGPRPKVKSTKAPSARKRSSAG